MNVVDYKVSNIKISGSITVDYTILLSNGMEKKLRVSSLETAHEDFYKALIDIKECFYQMIGFPIADAVTGEKLQVYVRKITFVNKTNCGRGMKITAAVDGIANHSDLTVLTTLPFYEKGTGITTIVTKDGTKDIFYQQLTQFQFDAMENMAKEAFAFAHYNKKEQPTLEEAAEGYFAEQGSLIDG